MPLLAALPPTMVSLRQRSWSLKLAEGATDRMVTPPFLSPQDRALHKRAKERCDRRRIELREPVSRAAATLPAVHSSPRLPIQSGLGTRKPRCCVRWRGWAQDPARARRAPATGRRGQKQGGVEHPGTAPHTALADARRPRIRS